MMPKKAVFSIQRPLLQKIDRVCGSRGRLKFIENVLLTYFNGKSKISNRMLQTEKLIAREEDTAISYSFTIKKKFTMNIIDKR
jgi:hypothetical protein